MWRCISRGVAMCTCFIYHHGCLVYWNCHGAVVRRNKWTLCVDCRVLFQQGCRTNSVIHWKWIVPHYAGGSCLGFVFNNRCLHADVFHGRGNLDNSLHCCLVHDGCHGGTSTIMLKSLFATCQQTWWPFPLEYYPPYEPMQPSDFVTMYRLHNRMMMANPFWSNKICFNKSENNL